MNYTPSEEERLGFFWFIPMAIAAAGVAAYKGYAAYKGKQQAQSLAAQAAAAKGRISILVTEAQKQQEAAAAAEEKTGVQRQQKTLEIGGVTLAIGAGVVAFIIAMTTIK